MRCRWEGDLPSGWILLNVFLSLSLSLSSPLWGHQDHLLFSKWAFLLAGALHPLFSDCLSAANAWQVDCSGLAGRERAALCSGPGLKDTDYCFPPSLIEALERKDFNLLSSLLPEYGPGTARWPVSSERLHKLIRAKPPPPPLSSNPAFPERAVDMFLM